MSIDNALKAKKEKALKLKRLSYKKSMDELIEENESLRKKVIYFTKLFEGILNQKDELLKYMNSTNTEYFAGDFYICDMTRIFRYKGENYKLNEKEFNLMLLLIQNYGVKPITLSADYAKTLSRIKNKFQFARDSIKGTLKKNLQLNFD